MRLPGRLSATTLGDLLGVMHRERLSGILELIEIEGAQAGRAHRVHLDAGLVAQVDSALGVPRVGEILKQQGFVGDEALRRLTRELTRAPGRRAGEVLLEGGQLSPQALGAALRRQLRQRLDALFTLPDAELRFHVRRATTERPIPLSPREFLHQRPRKRDRDGSRRPPVGTAPPTPGRDRARSQAFAVLGLAADAPRDSVQRAFRKLARAAHPDRHPAASSEERAELLKQFAALSAAYHLLVA
ncbi:MAG: J domain-containing protein [Myxococcales bacterium]|nr:J domain-containing protein [Myxococcales bacterium]